MRLRPEGKVRNTTKKEWAGHSEGSASRRSSGRNPGKGYGVEFQRLKNVLLGSPLGAESGGHLEM